jgi:elongation factor G
MDAMEKGPLTGNPVVGLHFILEDGLTHAVDSSEMAFRIAGFYAAREGSLLCNIIDQNLTKCL